MGEHQSVVDSPWGTMLGGFHTSMFWKAVYWSMQMSITNKVICLLDWTRSRTRGRDVGRDHILDGIPQIPTNDTQVKLKV